MSYDEHLISMAGGDGDVLAEIEARLSADESAFRQPGYIGGEQCMTDRTYLIALVREQARKLESGLTLADKWAALGPEGDWADGGMADTVLSDAGRAFRAALTATESVTVRIAHMEGTKPFAYIDPKDEK